MDIRNHFETSKVRVIISDAGAGEEIYPITENLESAVDKGSAEPTAPASIDDQTDTNNPAAMKSYVRGLDTVADVNSHVRTLGM